MLVCGMDAAAACCLCVCTLDSVQRCGSTHRLWWQQWWQYVQQHLRVHELQRYGRLRHVSSDAGRDRTWLRAAFVHDQVSKCYKVYLCL